MEVLVITEGTSESAKAIGIRRAKGDVIGILASDNELTDSNFLSHIIRPLEELPWLTASYPAWYNIKGDILNRYFALIGANDPLASYMNKCDRWLHTQHGCGVVKGDYTIRYFHRDNLPTIGDNGCFFRSSFLKEYGDLDNYYHIDVGVDLLRGFHNAYAVVRQRIFHNTGGNIFKFFQKRYRYGLEHAFNPNRRWHLVDFRRKEDICRLAWFILASLTVIHPLLTSIRGYLKLKDLAWFLHPLVCVMTVLTYGVLVIHVACRRMFQSLFALMAARSL